MTAEERGVIEKLLAAARLPAGLVNDFTRNDLSVVELMGMTAGALSKEPPDGSAVQTLMVMLKSGSAGSGDAAWPDSAGDAAAQSKYSSWSTKFVTLCRMAQPLVKAALDARAEASGLSKAAPADADKKRREEFDALRKDAAHRQRSLGEEAQRVYNRVFEMNEVDCKTLVESEISFRTGLLSIGSISSGKYGTTNAVQSGRPKAEVEDGALVIGDDETDVDLSKNGLALMQIWNCTESLVVASVKCEINPAVQHMAGSHGKISRGGVDRQVQFDATTQVAVFKAFTHLSAYINPTVLVFTFSGRNSYITV